MVWSSVVDVYVGVVLSNVVRCQHASIVVLL